MFAVQYLVKLVIKLRIFSPVAKQPALSWQPFCAALVRGSQWWIQKFWKGETIYQPVLIHRKCTQRSIGLLHGKGRLLRKNLSQYGGAPTALFESVFMSVPKCEVDRTTWYWDKAYFRSIHCDSVTYICDLFTRKLSRVTRTTCWRYVAILKFIDLRPLRFWNIRSQNADFVARC